MLFVIEVEIYPLATTMKSNKMDSFCALLVRFFRDTDRVSPILSIDTHGLILARFQVVHWIWFHKSQEQIKVKSNKVKFFSFQANKSQEQ